MYFALYKKKRKMVYVFKVIRKCFMCVIENFFFSLNKKNFVKKIIYCVYSEQMKGIEGRKRERQGRRSEEVC